MSVSEAAARLGVTEDAVRKRIAGGGLPARRQGREWRLEASAVERAVRIRAPRGRRLSPPTAWVILLLASATSRRPLCRGTTAWCAAAPQRGSIGIRSSLALRGWARARRPRSSMSHASELARLRDRSDTLATGISVGELVGLTSSPSSVEIYAPRASRETLLDEHALDAGAGAVRVRWVHETAWPLISGRARAPDVAVLLDLLEHEDPRARREATLALGG